MVTSNSEMEEEYPSSTKNSQQSSTAENSIDNKIQKLQAYVDEIKRSWKFNKIQQKQYEKDYEAIMKKYMELNCAIDVQIKCATYYFKKEILNKV